MASGPITSWQREGKKVETVTNFLFLGFKITADNDCSYEIRRYSILGMKIKDEMVGWHHQLKGHEFEQISGDGDGQGSLACYTLWSLKMLGST